MSFNSVVRATERAHRQWEAQLRRQRAEAARSQREFERRLKQQEKADKQAYLASRIEETDDMNRALAATVMTLETLLEQTLAVDDHIAFGSLRLSDRWNAAPVPDEFRTPGVRPRIEYYTSDVKPIAFWQRVLGMTSRHARDMAAAKARFDAATSQFEEQERARLARLAGFQGAQELAKRDFLEQVRIRNAEVDKLESEYQAGVGSAILTYHAMVLERSKYPDEFPQNFRLAFEETSKQLVIDYDLPGLDIVPKESEFKYVKSKDAIEAKSRKASDSKELFQDVVAAVALRTIHEIFEADRAGHVGVIVFNGFIDAIDPATGKSVRPCIVSTRATRDAFVDLDLAKVEKRVCLRTLGAQVSAHPQALQAVRPIVEFNMVDKRFIEEQNVLGDLESRPNLMDLTPGEFEALTSNLFGKMGLETKLTRSSRDGGVDAVAFDKRPVLGGKVVIQAKRYKHTVGVAFVRDLFGTMLNEGANKGILVATSGYGPDAYEFAKDKPIELIDGTGLLYLLKEVGIEARIVIPNEDAGAI